MFNYEPMSVSGTNGYAQAGILSLNDGIDEGVMQLV